MVNKRPVKANPSPEEYSDYEKAVYYMVSQVPPGHFTGITSISDVLHSGPSNVGSALRRAPAGIPVHRALQTVSSRGFWLTNRPNVDVALLQAEGIHGEQHGKEYHIQGIPWTGFTNIPTQNTRKRIWNFPVPWAFPPVVAPAPAPAPISASGLGPASASGPGPAFAAGSDAPLFGELPWSDSDSDRDEDADLSDDGFSDADVRSTLQRNQKASEKEVEIKSEQSEVEDWELYALPILADPENYRQDKSDDDLSGDNHSGTHVPTERKRNEEASEEETKIKSEVTDYEGWTDADVRSTLQRNQKASEKEVEIKSEQSEFEDWELYALPILADPENYRQDQSDDDLSGDNHSGTHVPTKRKRNEEASEEETKIKSEVTDDEGWTFHPKSPLSRLAALKQGIQKTVSGADLSQKVSDEREEEDYDFEDILKNLPTKRKHAEEASDDEEEEESVSKKYRKKN